MRRFWLHTALSPQGMLSPLRSETLRVNMSETLPPSEFSVEGGEELSDECAA